MTRESTNLVSDGRHPVDPIERNSDRLEAIFTRVPWSELLDIQSHNLLFVVNTSTGDDRRYAPCRWVYSEPHKHP